MTDAIAGQFSDMLSDTVAVETLTGTDGFGDPTYEDKVDRSARVGAGGERMIGEDGQEFVTKGKVIFAGSYGVKQGDRLTLPEDFQDREVIVRRAFPVRDENGPHHDKVFF